ncbi:MAG: alpha/beta hydrolase [Cypionkella sp.]
MTETSRPPLSGGASDTAQGTQSWDADQQIKAGPYTVSRVSFLSDGDTIIGNLVLPTAGFALAAVVILGPVATVKEQAPMQYATRLALAGLSSLVFDPRGTGESDGTPRRWESGARKTADLRAALAYLATVPEVDPDRLHLLGLCQGANWAIAAALEAASVRSLALVAGHYLTPEICAMYYGSAEAVAARVAQGQAAADAFAAYGTVSYLPIVNESTGEADPDVLLNFDGARMYYRPWADRNLFLAHRGQWENRIAAMSEADLWTTRTDLAMAQLTTRTLMIHADRAASGPKVPRALFDAIATARKELVWLGNQTQFQFYEDPITIDAATQHLAAFYLEQA